MLKKGRAIPSQLSERQPLIKIMIESPDNPTGSMDWLQIVMAILAISILAGLVVEVITH